MEQHLVSHLTPSEPQALSCRECRGKPAESLNPLWKQHPSRRRAMSEPYLEKAERTGRLIVPSKLGAVPDEAYTMELSELSLAGAPPLPGAVLGISAALGRLSYMRP